MDQALQAAGRQVLSKQHIDEVLRNSSAAYQRAERAFSYAIQNESLLHVTKCQDEFNKLCVQLKEELDQLMVDIETDSSLRDSHSPVLSKLWCAIGNGRRVANYACKKYQEKMNSSADVAIGYIGRPSNASSSCDIFRKAALELEKIELKNKAELKAFESMIRKREAIKKLNAAKKEEAFLQRFIGSQKPNTLIDENTTVSTKPYTSPATQSMPSNTPSTPSSVAVSSTGHRLVYEPTITQSLPTASAIPCHYESIHPHSFTAGSRPVIPSYSQSTPQCQSGLRSNDLIPPPRGQSTDILNVPNARIDLIPRSCGQSADIRYVPNAHTYPIPRSRGQPADIRYVPDAHTDPIPRFCGQAAADIRYVPNEQTDLTPRSHGKLANHRRPNDFNVDPVPVTHNVLIPRSSDVVSPNWQGNSVPGAHDDPNDKHSAQTKPKSYLRTLFESLGTSSTPASDTPHSGVSQRPVNGPSPAAISYTNPEPNRCDSPNHDTAVTIKLFGDATIELLGAVPKAQFRTVIPNSSNVPTGPVLPANDKVPPQGRRDLIPVAVTASDSPASCAPCYGKLDISGNSDADTQAELDDSEDSDANAQLLSNVEDAAPPHTTNIRHEVFPLKKTEAVKPPYNKETDKKSLENQRSKFAEEPEFFQKHEEKYLLPRWRSQVILPDLLPPSERTLDPINFYTQQRKMPSSRKLQLAAAVSGNKLATDVVEDFNYDIDSARYCTDSTAMLRSIRTTSARLNAFVRQRPP